MYNKAQDEYTNQLGLFNSNNYEEIYNYHGVGNNYNNEYE
jgi:hypothetical protein